MKFVRKIKILFTVKKQLAEEAQRYYKQFLKEKKDAQRYKEILRWHREAEWTIETSKDKEIKILTQEIRDLKIQKEAILNQCK